VRLVWCWILVALIVVICVGGLLFAFLRPEQVSKGLLAFLGGPTLLALLGLAARTIHVYSEDRMTLLVLEHGTNAQVADYIDTVREAKRRAVAKTRGAGASTRTRS
jgi:hypothetical protein